MKTEQTSRFETFSVGVRPAVNDLRREAFDGICILAGKPNRLGNHTVAFERLISAVHELMMTDPAYFAQLFGEGSEANDGRFAAFVARLMEEK